MAAPVHFLCPPPCPAMPEGRPAAEAPVAPRIASEPWSVAQSRGCECTPVYCTPSLGGQAAGQLIVIGQLPFSVFCPFPAFSPSDRIFPGTAWAMPRHRQGLVLGWGRPRRPAAGILCALGAPCYVRGPDLQPGQVPRQQGQGLCHQGHIPGAFRNKGGASLDSDKDGIANLCKAGIMVRCHGPRDVQIEKTMTQIT